MKDFNKDAGLRSFFTKIYSKMALGVLLTAIISFLMVYSAPGHRLFEVVFSSKIIFYGIIAIELALLFGIQWGINKVSKKTAEFLFYLYAALSGVTLSVILLAYTGGTLLTAFVSAIAVFIALAALGKTMKYNMSGWGTFLYAGMWGVFVASLLNIFLASTSIDWVISIVAVLVFSGLTVYDAQSYKKMYLASHEGQDLSKMITLGALHMYINFVMIFVNLLKILGGRD